MAWAGACRHKTLVKAYRARVALDSGQPVLLGL